MNHNNNRLEQRKGQPWCHSKVSGERSGRMWKRDGMARSEKDGALLDTLLTGGRHQQLTRLTRHPGEEYSRVLWHQGWMHYHSCQLGWETGRKNIITGIKYALKGDTGWNWDNHRMTALGLNCRTCVESKRMQILVQIAASKTRPLLYIGKECSRFFWYVPFWWHLG